MAAILNPTAHSTLFNQTEGPVEHPVSLAPWNRDLELRRPHRHLHLVTNAAPVLLAPRRRLTRTIVAGVGLALLIAFAGIGALPFLGADAAAFTPATPTDVTSPTVADTQNVSASVVASVTTDPVGRSAVAADPVEIIVQQGDSLWTVARRLQPRGDLRLLVDRLIERVGSTSVTRGQHINLSGILD
ncbi:MAG: hypothetical protein WEA11_01385 [Acidimicrobiales bacterium]